MRQSSESRIPTIALKLREDDETMWTDRHRKGLALFAMLFAAALTTSAAGEVPLLVPQSALVALVDTGELAAVYTAPDGYVPASTGALPNNAATAQDDASAWVALRSPTTADSSKSKRAKRHLYSPRGRNRWKGENTRYRPLSELRLAVEDHGLEDWVYPIDEKHIAGSPFGRRRDPITHQRRNHYGQDIGCRRGTPIYAVADGTVATSRNSRTAGRYIELSHSLDSGEVLRTRYLHLRRRMVRRGETVQRGQLIGRCGSTGSSTSPHLHFGVWLDDKPLVPFTVYRQFLAGEEAEKRAWDESIALAVEMDTLDELLGGEAVPREVVKLVAEYRKGRGKRPPRLLSSASRPDVDALLKARGGPQ
jgi:murein DD-endopeptidase MepM/ murein hydrolase activator NlpD